MAWWQPAWTFIDQNLKDIADSLKAKLQFFRLLRNVMAFSIVSAYVAAVGVVVWPEQMRWFLAAGLVGLSLPAIYWFVIVSLPLKATSIVRLIDMGYPANGKELAIRFAARKLHDQSIETEELLVDTALNEGRKAYAKYKARAAAMAEADPEPAPDAASEETDKP